MLQAALASSLAAWLRPPTARAADIRFTSDPFTLGVASGYPRPDGFTLWTRLAPSPLDPDGGMTPEAVEVGFEVADDERFSKIRVSGSIGAYVEQAHSVRLDIRGLDPGRPYWYRFRAGAEVSPVGRTATTAPIGAKVSKLRLGLGSCQHYEQGWYVAHRHLQAENLDLMLFVGDYIYELSWGSSLVRRHAGLECYTLADYRVRHAQTKLDPDLQGLHATVPWMLIWDDHEVDNDWAGGQSEHLDPAFLERRRVAFQAFFEHLPMPARLLPTPQGVITYCDLVWGDLARLYLLDDRQYRSPQVCPNPMKGGGSNIVRPDECPEWDAPGRTLLGATQELWLDRSMRESRARWNLIVQQTMMSPCIQGPNKGLWTDGWDGYPRDRERLLGAVAKRRLRNPLVLGGDIHGTAVADLHTDPRDPDTPVIATEICGTSITSQGLTEDQSKEAMKDNPHLTYMNGWQRGYITLELGSERCETKLRVVDAKKRDSGVDTAATFVVADGKPGATKA